jgi:hypothetical protein
MPLPSRRPSSIQGILPLRKQRQRHTTTPPETI